MNLARVSTKILNLSFILICYFKMLKLWMSLLKIDANVVVY